MEDAIFRCVVRILKGDKHANTLLTALFMNHKQEWEAKLDGATGDERAYIERRMVPQGFRWAAFIKASLRDPAQEGWTTAFLKTGTATGAPIEWLQKEQLLRKVEDRPQVASISEDLPSDPSSSEDPPTEQSVSEELSADEPVEVSDKPPIVEQPDTNTLYQEALATEGPYSARAYYYGSGRVPSPVPCF
jgi:hypothetical protein